MKFKTKCSLQNLASAMTINTGLIENMKNWGSKQKYQH